VTAPPVHVSAARLVVFVLNEVKKNDELAWAVKAVLNDLPQEDRVEALAVAETLLNALIDGTQQLSEQAGPT
jgi:DNA/RNA-binding domain of Phe-tRNA-synthetase-like protein